jgi:TRAP transporter 4TM/12TM fusion protein
MMNLLDKFLACPPIWIIRIIAASILSLFSIYTAFFGVFPDMIQRSFHIGIILFLVYLFPLQNLSYNDLFRSLKAYFFIILSLLSLLVMVYQIIFFDAINDRYGELTNYEFYLGLAATFFLLDATRRTIGWSISILAIIFLLYALLGSYLPGEAGHRGYSLHRIMSHLYLGGSGIFGTPLGVTATFVILIVLFGAVLENSGAGKVLMDIANSLTGKSRGGPAKAAVVGSSLMGMISGTAVANVLTTGTISIPLMKRTGYRPETAGAIEAVASTGGQLMPPVMGAAAFLMSDMTGISYYEIARAALLPAVLYYIVLFSVVHIEAIKRNIPIIDTKDIPSIWETLRKGGHLLLSLPVFIYMMFDGYSVMYASIWSLMMAVALSYVRRATWLTPKKILRTIENGVEAVIPVATACACAGIIIGIITLTGLGLKFSSLVISLSGGNIFLALLLTMIASLILGMGLPTAAAYILVATLAAPALEELGINQLAAHLFVFYSAMLSSITPPVALAAYAASGLANANPFRIALVSCQFGVAAFIIPYFFAYNPVLIGIDASFQMIFLAAFSAIFGSLCLSIFIQGWLISKLLLIERLGYIIVTFCLLSVSFTTDLIGFGLLIMLVSFHYFVRNPKRQIV